MSTLQAANIQSLSSATLPVIKDSAGTEYGRFCRAFVNFDGTTSPGTIRASFNVSSVTKNGTGDYSLNFTNAMPDTNYTATFSVGSSRTDQSSGGLARQLESVYALSSSSTFRVYQAQQYTPYGFVDATYNCISIFR